jgi:hypothetical protein
MTPFYRNKYYTQTQNDYNTPKGSCWIGDFAADASVRIGREGDEAERCCGLGGADSADRSVLAGLSETGVHGVRGKTGASRTEGPLSEGLDDECPKPRWRRRLFVCDVTVFCASNRVLVGLPSKGGYPETWGTCVVAGGVAWVFSCALSAFSSNSLVSSTAETEPLRTSLAYVKDSRACRFLRIADSPSSS